MPIVDVFVNNIYSALVSWTYILLAVLLIVKLLQSVGVNIPGLGGSSGSKDPDSPEEKKRKQERDRPDKVEEEKKKFEEGVANPARLKVWVRNEDDKNIQGADVTVYARKHKGEAKFGPHATNRDGIFPSTGEFANVPSGVALRIHVVYWLPRPQIYKGRKRSWTKLWLGKKRQFVVNENLTLAAGEERIHPIQLPFKSEYAEGFEPFIYDVDIKSDPNNIHTKAIIKSTTGE